MTKVGTSGARIAMCISATLMESGDRTMPSCFALYRKGETEPMILHHVDLEMREHFGVEDDGNWYKNWYNTIGLSLAIGHDLEKIREFFPDKVDVIEFLEANYSTDSWKEFK
jgi:hypothetical protein